MSIEIKICGLKYASNFKDLNYQLVDMIGLNFYPRSPRYLPEDFNKEILANIPPEVKKVGVFVNEKLDSLRKIFEDYSLDYAQLHGDEDPDYINTLNDHHIPCIKAFRINEDFQWDSVKEYSFCPYFLFDTHTNIFGGSGQKFNWNRLDAYQLQIPFLLSGGIGPEDIELIREFQHGSFAGIDINSRFENSPGFKDISVVHTFIQQLRAVYEA